MVKTKQTISNLIRFLLFLLPLVVMLMLLSVLVRPKENLETAGMTDYLTRSIVAEPSNTIDVLIIGDSESYSSFSPVQMWEEQGFTSYVCGSPAQKLYESLEYLNTALETQTPKVVVLEVNNVFRTQAVEDMLYGKACGLLPVLRYHDRWKELTTKDFTFSVHYSSKTKFKGYQFKRKIADGTKEGYMDKKEKPVAISVKNYLYLDEIRNICDKRGIKLVLVNAPQTKSWNSAKHNSIQDYADANGVTYLDMNLLNDEVKIDWKQDTADGGDHLNVSGAQKATAYLGAWLKESCQLPQHDGDAVAEDWNELLKPYHEEMKKGV